MPPAGAFLVYTTESVSLDPIVQKLNHGRFGDASSGDIWFPVPAETPSFINAPVSAVVAHHRAHPGNANKRFFVVIDRVDWANEGVLGVNLNFDGFIDAARFASDVAGSAIASVDVGNSDWYETITEILDPPRFVLYPATKTLSADAKSKEALRSEVQAGVASRKQYSEGALTCHLAPSCPEVIDEDVSMIAEGHVKVAEELGCDPELFIVADEADWGHWGLITGKIGKGGAGAETCRKSVDVAAEVLHWVRAGLLTWEEGKEWDEEEAEVEG
ncbi:MAG: hypothetical protein OHK93_001224 [Ramalina farinacea]|uniref:Uncharacterized protein n=1 Tax=Ramalina farinacea TaxID=258253 RepID=A0AA43QTF0_9LECA|nr:hypothetical protein [Ramalina farinacea]